MTSASGGGVGFPPFENPMITTGIQSVGAISYMRVLLPRPLLSGRLGQVSFLTLLVWLRGVSSFFRRISSRRISPYGVASDSLYTFRISAARHGIVQQFRRATTSAAWTNPLARLLWVPGVS